MRLFRLEDSGEPVRDIQDRLAALGHPSSPDPPGRFGPATHEAVVAFQQARGLTPDGIVGPETWRELVEAGYRLGDRLLYLRRPMLRGDDVAELQRRLGSLGFDAGKVDGIFGPDTLRAVLEFQQNRGMSEDGIAGPEVVEELGRVDRATRKAGRQAVWEREWLRSLPSTVVGRRLFLDPACRDPAEAAAAWESASVAAHHLRSVGAHPILSRSLDTALPTRIRARKANRLGADLVVGFRHAADDARAVFFFTSPLSRSEVGARLAAELALRLDLPVEGRASTLLKETRAPAALVSAHPLGAKTGLAVAEALVSFFSGDPRADQARNCR